MIKSMTGYGRAKLSKDDREYQIEIKSVNHRYLDISDNFFSLLVLKFAIYLSA